MNASEARQKTDEIAINRRKQELDDILECIKKKIAIGEGSLIYECMFREETKEHFESLGYTCVLYGVSCPDLAIYW